VRAVRPTIRVLWPALACAALAISSVIVSVMFGLMTLIVMSLSRLIVAPN